MFKSFSSLAAAAFLMTTPSYGFFIDGEGHYSVMGETETMTGYVKSRGMHEAVRQSFRLLGEVRPNDRTSMFIEFRLFDDPRKSYWGDDARPANCSVKNGDVSSNAGSSSGAGCDDRHQDLTYPGYAPYIPKITQAYARYSSEYCLIEAGRRGRDWGLGMFLDSGSKPFAMSMSVFDGISCEVNIQRSQTLGFAFGYDKLAETGASGEPQLQDGNGIHVPGGSSRGDDIDQFFVTIEYDDRKANAGSAFTRQIGFYIANIFEKGYKTDVKFADFYSGFFFPNLAIRNEILFRLGKSADPSWARYGGRGPYPYATGSLAAGGIYGEPARNDLDSIAVAGNIEYTFSRSGSFLGPSEYQQGNAARHAMILDYAYAPGDRDGYFDQYSPTDGASQRNSKVTAMALNRNFKPALLLFNGRSEIDDMRVDGVFDPNSIMNAMVLGLAYRFESVMYGNFESKIITAQLTQGISEAAKANYLPLDDRPVGFGGRDLGYELDLKYSRNLGKDFEFGVAGAIGLPGDAWQTKKDQAAVPNYLLQSHVTFNF